MVHKTISINSISFKLPHKTCFDDFSVQIYHGDKIGIIGRNGSGKTSLLQSIMEYIEVSNKGLLAEGRIIIGYVPQIILGYGELSGGERFNKSLTEALAKNPDLLLLDEPTNHLDQKTRYSLMRMLNNFCETVIMVTHDVEVLEQCVDRLWHIENGKVNVFFGDYNDYIQEKCIEMNSKEKILGDVQKEKKRVQTIRRQEISKSAKAGGRKPKDNDRLSFNGKASGGQSTSDAKISKFTKELEKIQSSIGDNRIPKIVNPSFIINNDYVSSLKNILTVSAGSCGYTTPILSDISISMKPNDKIALIGNNGSGKTTFLKAIIGSLDVWTNGEWIMPNKKDIGYLDQYYGTLDPEKTVEDTIWDRNPALNRIAIRNHLNGFLFIKNEEALAKVKDLSGGEKARLSLAQIAAKPPKLLILDEVTNNVDIETKQYMIQVLSQYSGAMIIISHEKKFLDQLSLTNEFTIKDGRLQLGFVKT